MTISTDINQYNSSVIAENKTINKLFSNIFYVVSFIIIAIIIIISWINNETIDINQKNTKIGIYSYILILIILSINNSVITNNLKKIYEKPNNTSTYFQNVEPNIIKASENIFDIQ